jgi:holo-[acyl-carrier protein] synthase
MLRTGVDLIEIERVHRAIDRHGARFLNRVFTAAEVDQSCGRIESLAGKFAAKEAAAKALGTGVWRNGIDWRDFEVCKDPETGAPELRLHDAAAERAVRLGLGTWSVSISHDRTRAIAFVVAT